MTAPLEPEAIARRFAAQGLTGQAATTPEKVVERLLAVQAQDPRGARLAIRVRSEALTGSDVDDALMNRRSLVVSWVNRGTLHLVRSEDFWWLHALTAPQVEAGNARRLAQNGVLPGQVDHGVQLILDTIHAHGPQTRSQLREMLDGAGVPTQGQALVHLLEAATIRAQLIRVPMSGGRVGAKAEHPKGDFHGRSKNRPTARRESSFLLAGDIGSSHQNAAGRQKPTQKPAAMQPASVDREPHFVTASQWLGGAPRSIDRDSALGQLALRYVMGHGPASTEDLSKWAGMRLTDARRALAGVRDALTETENGLFDLKHRPSYKEEVPPPRLMGAFDPILLGWTSRAFVTGPYKEIVTINGLFRPFVMLGGRAVGIWRMERGQVQMHLFESIRDADSRALKAEAEDVKRYLGIPEIGGG